MATTRKRSTSGGFAPKEEVTLIEEFLEEATEELIESIEKEERMPVVLDTIEPAEPVAPRLPAVEPKKEVPVARQQPILNPPPKRHPRNIPKFSNYK